MNLAGKYKNAIGTKQAFDKAGVNFLDSLTQDPQGLQDVVNFYVDNPLEFKKLKPNASNFILQLANLEKEKLKQGFEETSGLEIFGQLQKEI